MKDFDVNIGFSAIFINKSLTTKRNIRYKIDKKKIFSSLFFNKIYQSIFFMQPEVG